MTFLYTLTSCMMLHKMASLQLIYPVTLLLPTFIYLTYHSCCWEHVTYCSHGILSLGWQTNANWSCQQALITFYVLLYKIIYNNRTLWAAVSSLGSEHTRPHLGQKLKYEKRKQWIDKNLQWKDTYAENEKCQLKSRLNMGNLRTGKTDSGILHVTLLSSVCKDRGMYSELGIKKEL